MKNCKAFEVTKVPDMVFFRLTDSTSYRKVNVAHAKSKLKRQSIMTSNLLTSILNKQETGQIESNQVHKDNVNPDITFKSNEELEDLLKNAKYNFSKNFKKKVQKQIKWNNSIEERKLKRKADRKTQKEKEKVKRAKYNEKFSSGDKKTLLESIPFKICKKRKLATTENIEKGFHVAIDLSSDLDQLMTCVMVRNLATQLSWAYKINRKLKNPSQIWFCDMQERLRETMLKQFGGFENWDLNHFSDSFSEIGKLDSEESKSKVPPKIVYLSADSQNVLQSLEQGTVYVIGGLVDRNSHKNFCQEKAEKLGITTAKLPLTDFVEFSEINRPLTVNHVCEIMVKVNNQIIDRKTPKCEQNFENEFYTEIWREAIVGTLPSRKKLKVKDSNCQSEGHQLDELAEATSDV